MTARELARADLLGLAGEIEEALRRLRQLAAEVVSLDPGPAGDPPRTILALLAVDLHSYYTTLESIIERVVVALEGRSPVGPAAHSELLRRATRPLEGIRPALFAADQMEALDELRRFRHFFRHAYALDLRHAKLRRALDPFAARHAHIEGDLERFAAFLARTIAELDAE